MAVTNFPDNNVQGRGLGLWKIVVYQPLTAQPPIFYGNLVVGKDFHTVYAAMNDGSQGPCVFSAPSQNVAYAFDQSFVDQQLTDAKMVSTGQ